MVKKLFLKIFVFFAFLACSLVDGAQFSGDFFNVGQGNCTGVNFGKNSPFLLVDAGSSASDKDVEIDPDDVAIATFKARRLSEIGESIKMLLPKGMAQQLTLLSK